MKSWVDFLSLKSFLLKIKILEFVEVLLRQANFCVSCSGSFKFLRTFSSTADHSKVVDSTFLSK